MIALLAIAPVVWLKARPVPDAFAATQAAPADFPQLWSAFFAPDARNVVAYGVPLFYNSSGLYMRDVDVNVPGQEKNGRILEFASKFNLILNPTDDTYTGVGEVVGTHLVANFFEARGIPVRVTNARSISPTQLAGQNLVVVSSLRFQTLLRDLDLPAEFEFVGSHPELIRNLHPLPGEQPEYIFRSGAGVQTSYALVSLWPAPTPGRRLLHIGGVHTWATQGATEFLLQPDQLRKLAAEFRQDQTTHAHGKVSPFFQIVLRVEGRLNHSQKIDYVTHHYLPAR